MTLEEMTQYATERSNFDHDGEQAWMRTVEICSRLERIAGLLSDMQDSLDSIDSSISGVKVG